MDEGRSSNFRRPRRRGVESSTPCTRTKRCRNRGQLWHHGAMRRALLIAVLLGGCHFGLKGVGVDNAPGGDDAGVSSGNADLGPSTATGDMGGFLPSHVPPGTLNPEAADMPLGIVAIDTSALTINGGTPPAGVVFQVDESQPGWAELIIGGWTMNQNVKVTGVRALIVVAAKKVDVVATIDASADHLTAGPGATTAGQGGPGTTTGDNDSGGGGGGSDRRARRAATRRADRRAARPESSYGDTRTFFGGGSPGGIGGGATACGATEMTKGRGGAGGGALQNLVGARGRRGSDWRDQHRRRRRHRRLRLAGVGGRRRWLGRHRLSRGAVGDGARQDSRERRRRRRCRIRQRQQRRQRRQQRRALGDGGERRRCRRRRLFRPHRTAAMAARARPATAARGAARIRRTAAAPAVAPGACGCARRRGRRRSSAGRR